jgi:hypothetical protein
LVRERTYLTRFFNYKLQDECQYWTYFDNLMLCLEQNKKG